MLIANGASEPGQAVWRQTVSVVPETAYTFSFCAAGVDPAPSGASLQALVEGVAVGTPLTVNSTPGAWTCNSVTWVSGSATTATVSIVDANTAVTNNDYALDHVTLTSCQLTLPR